MRHTRGAHWSVGAATVLLLVGGVACRRFAGNGPPRNLLARNHETSPVWSPDGRKIAYSRTSDDGIATIHVMDADGGGVRQLTRTPHNDRNPSWSPDGKRIAFTRSDSQNSSHIYVMDADGGAQRQLTSGPGREVSPCWSPDGKWIAFTRIVKGRHTVWRMDPDGGGQRKITTGWNPSWSADGKQIACTPLEGPDGMFVVNVDGRGRRRLVASPKEGIACCASWSPDGTWIAYVEYPGSDLASEIYRIGADGSGRTPLTRGARAESAPSWSPDGKQLLFSREGTRRSEIWSIPTDQGVVDLTPGAAGGARRFGVSAP